MAICLLPPLLINQIAAGEVIERPASVVKELVENSLDAGATRIEVVIEEGGQQLIRIRDDGCGIPANELHLALTAHATSKLQTPEQLASIGTLGFRGEALASVASVSRLKITSRAMIDGKLAEAAATIEAHGDQLGEVRPDSSAGGTVIEIRDLFHNTPARRKFLRNPTVEFGHISDVLERIAMVWNHVGFSLMHNGRKVFDLPANQSRRARCVDVLGKELDQGLLEFNSTSNNPDSKTTLWGLAGKPNIARATAKFQFLCINGRPIKDRSLSHAMKEAYRGLIAPEQQPVAVVFIDMEPTMLDVNVHPAKSEVRFRDANAMHGLVLTALRQRLLGADLTPSAMMRWGNTPTASATAFGGFANSSGQGTGVGTTRLTDNEQSPFATNTSSISSPESSMRAFVDYFRTMAPQQKGLVYQEVKKAIAEENPTQLLDEAAENRGANANTNAPPPQENIPLKPITILQVHDSYVVTQDEQGLLIIDQHALHERVMFEQLLQKVSSHSLESQRLLVPVTLSANPRRMALLESLEPLLTQLGIEVQPIGPGTLAVHAFPSMLFDRGVDPLPFMDELLDKVQDGKIDVSNATAHESALHEVLDMMACKAAIKAGQTLSHSELLALLQKREEIERSSNCPHGRPTTLRMTLKDLEKQFKRS